jgi:RNA 2',3'-cyclic 3'-phosphodiesterase
MFDPRTLETQRPLPGMGLAEEPPFLPEPLAGRSPADRYLLFAALLPDEPAAAQAWRLAQDQRRIHGLRQPAMAAGRLHITVLPIVGFEHAVPRLVIDAAIDAMATAATGLRAVPIGFDRLGSMGQAAPTALVLLCDPACQQAIAALRSRLARPLRQRQFEVARPAAPHMTLVYGTGLVAERAIDPIRWAATRLVLVLSHHGRGHHELIREWPLA